MLFMSINTYLERMHRIDRLIRLSATGSPNQLAVKLGISKRMVYKYLDEMKKLGAPIEYDKCRNSYIYTAQGQLLVAFNSSEKNVG